MHISHLAIEKTYAVGASSQPRTEGEWPEFVIDERYEDFLVDQLWRVKAASGEIENMRDHYESFWDVFGEPLPYVLFGNSEGDESFAQALAEHYVELCSRWGLPLASEFVDEQEEWDDETHYAEKFREFLSEWRERIVEAIEARAATPEASTDKR